MVNIPLEEKQSTSMKNQKRFYKTSKPGRHFFQPSADEMVPTESRGENSVIHVEQTAPAIAIVAPTARNPNHGANMNNSMGPCKPNSSLVPQLAPPPRTMHVQHHIHHIQPVQLSTTALSPPPQQASGSSNSIQMSQPPPQATTVWPVVEPAFHFGPGFEIHQSYCPTHSHAEQHIVLFHLLPGVAVSFQIAGGRKIIQGPVTVPMVSQSGSPPIPMPVQVPPGHVMQQIVDENGTLRHVILSTQHQQMQGGVQGYHIHGHYLTANGSTPHYYNPIGGYPPTNSNSAGPGTTLYPTMANHQQPQMSHSPSPPNNNNTSSVNNNTAYQNNERAQRQYNKLKSKLDTRNLSTQVHAPPTRNIKNDNLNGSGTQRTLQRNGTSSGGGASSVGTSDDGEESSSVPDEEDDIQNVLIDYLSSIEPPMVKEIQSHTALVTWESPLPPTENALLHLNTSDIRYQILLGDRGKDGKYKPIFRGTNLSCRIQDLRAGQEYHVCLTANLNEIQGMATEPVVFKTPAREPDAPPQPKVIAKTKNSLQFRWNAPNDNGSHIIHYILEKRDNREDAEFTEICKIKSKQFTLNQLSPATWYTFRLAAVNECGRSEYSEQIAYVTDGYPPPQPSPPRVHNVTTSAIALMWDRRREDGEFILQMSNQGPQGYLNVYYGSEILYDCTRLQRATAYQFRLGSKTDAGQSPWSNEITISTLPEQPGRPTKPQVKGKIHAYNFKVKWDPPHDRGGADITLYHLEISSGAVFERVYSGPQPEATCERLSPGTTYQVRVLCEGPGGVSPPSDMCTVTTEAIVPNPPQTPYYSNLPGPYAAVLQWEKPQYMGGAPVTEYELELEGVLNDGVEKTKQQAIIYRVKESYCVVKDLLPGEAYISRVRAVNRIGTGEWSEDFNFRAGSAPPSKPQAPEIFVRSPSHLMVQWHEPQCNGAAIIDYKLESSMKQEEDAFSVVYHGSELHTDLNDLLPFTNYYFRLHAVNSAGRSPNSLTVCQKTPAAVPGIPTLLPDLFAITSSSAHIFWKEPESNGSPIVSYVLECGDRQLTSESTRTDLNVDHLSPEQMYKVKVQAVNSIGAGPFTQSYKIVTKPLPPKAPRLECIQYGYNSLKLKWGSDGTSTSNFQRFYLDMKIKSSSKDFQNVYTGTRNSIKVQKLIESTLYAFRISAQTDHAGIGPWSDEYLFKTQAAQPNSVKIVRCTENITGPNDGLPSLAVEWQHSKNNHFNDAVEYILHKALLAGGNTRNQTFEEVYRGAETRFVVENIDYDTDYCLRITPVRVMKSKRTTSICSSSTKTSSRDDIDAVDGARSSDESDSESDDNEDEKENVNDTPIAYEYVYGATSPVIHYKWPKSTEPTLSTNVSAATIISSQAMTARKSSKISSSKVASVQIQSTTSKKHQTPVQQQQQQTTDATADSSSDESVTEIPPTNASPFLKLINAIREFFYNRKNWSVTEESLFIWFVFMFFAVVVGCILHFIMA